MHRASGIAAILFGLTACDMGGSNAERWYSESQVESGRILFAKNCAACHGESAQGLFADWKRAYPDGSLPPPPLNGSAHAWHHPLPLLLEIVEQGGGRYNGKMPGFAGKLSEAEQYAVIAWFQSLWSDEIYRLWQKGNSSAEAMLYSPLVQENPDG
ncbi:MAG: cytochrome c [Mariprofundaceae bacterium]|nr:cytochrome c [Mariprofundaceae bacterium]